MSEKKVIVKKDWQSSFNLIGKPRINENYTFKIDERSEKSSWIYNAMNLGIDCGEKYGVVYAELMGGYSEVNENRIFAHGKNDDGSDNFEKSIVVDWEDRFDEDVLEEIGELSFITVGLEKTSTDKTFYKKFLSAYDAIAYIKEHLNENMVVNVRGNLKYSTYNDVVQVRKNITSIVLSKVDDVSKHIARFTQSILIDKDSANLKPENIDKDKGVIYVNAKVLDYIKEFNGIEVKGQYPFNKQFEFEMDFNNETLCKNIMEKVFKVRKGITQITFEGEFVEGGAVVAATLDDVPDDIKSLIGVLYTEEEVLARCTANGNKERRMVLKKPMIKLVGEDKVPVIQMFPERYMEDDLVLDYLFDNKTDNAKEEVPFGLDGSEAADDMAWLNQLT